MHNFSQIKLCLNFMSSSNKICCGQCYGNMILKHQLNGVGMQKSEGQKPCQYMLQNVFPPLGRRKSKETQK